MILERLTVGPFAENTYVIGTPPRVAIVDPGGESDRLVETIEENGWEPEVVLLTHGHIDHIAHVAHVTERYDIGCLVHRDDEFLLDSPQFPEFASMLDARPCPPPDRYLEDGETLEVAGLSLEVIHAPGHSPGSVCFVDDRSRTILVGDVIFRRGIGRTDLPGGDMETLGESIRRRLFALEGDYELWPGHGPPTTLDEEREENPFFGERATVRLRV